MRTAALTGLLVAFGYAATAQLSLLPQVGFENSKTNINYNDLSSFSPLGVKFSPQVGFRMDYKFKQGHGPFLGISTSRSLVSYNFTNPETGMTSFSANAGDMQLRIETGYQHSFKPIYFNKSKSQQVSRTKTYSTPASSNYSKAKQACGSKQIVAKKSCSSSKSASSSSASSASKCGSKTKQVLAKKEKGSWMRIQPSLGLGFIPAVKSDIITKTQGGATAYEYRAGNWNSALITGTAFEFGRNNSRLFTVSVNYFQGLGNLRRQTLTTVSGTKTTVTHLQSDVSGWNLKIGIPFTLAKKPAVKKHEIREKKECAPYKIQYKYKCGGQRS